ncbi:MAG TPA: peptidyl-prolyl cis-trans isomerase [Caulobacteraceae bacterium]|jgi:peptidyl-prolyl cis-trans isomerase D|nr:peptidyl-prolyl cis-trans isomerase [Caulobacteraceae bacterium]
MLAAIRAFAKSWVAQVLIGLLVVSFSVWGVRDVLHPKFTDDVVTAGQHSTSPNEFKRVFEGLRQQAVQQNGGQDVSLAEAVAAGLDQRALTEAEASEAFAEYLRRIGLVPAPQLILNELRQQPGFFNALGQFDKDTYQQKLASAGLTAAQYESLVADDIAQNQMAAGLAAGLKTPDIYGAVIAGYELESRNVSYLVLNPKSVPQPAPPTDAQLQALISQRGLNLPEMRTISLVRFSAKAIAPSMPVDEAAVQKLYAFRKDSLSQPEKRSLVEFSTRDAAKAAAIAAALKAGQVPDAVAKSSGVTPISFDDKPQGGIVDPDVAKAAFAAQNGQVVGPIASGLAGYAVIKLTKITPPSVPTLDSLRPQLEADVKTDAAIQKVFDGVKKYGDVHDSGASLADSAKAAGAAPVTVGPFTAQGGDLNGQAAPGLDARVVKEAFSLPQGGESEMEDEGNGEYFALRVEKISPPRTPTLAEIKPQLVQAYMQQALGKALADRANQLVQAIQKGESFDAAAASANVKAGVLNGITRAALQQGKQIQPEMIEQIFSAKKGQVFDGAISPVQIMVARIDDSHPAAGVDVARATAGQGPALAKQIFQDMGDAIRTVAVSTIKPQGDINAARKAIGLSPEDMPKSSAPAKRGPSL